VGHDPGGQRLGHQQLAVGVGPPESLRPLAQIGDEVAGDGWFPEPDMVEGEVLNADPPAAGPAKFPIKEVRLDDQPGPTPG